MSIDYTIPHGINLDTPYLADYFGIWQVDEQVFRSLAERMNGMNLHAHISSNMVQQNVQNRDRRDFIMTTDGIAMIRINGPTMKAVPSMAEGTSTVRIRQQLRQAQRDSEVRGVMLVMDTPGGTVKGNSDLVQEVRNLAAVKPVYAFIEDMTASAGVATASQATKRFANHGTAIYGSIGTYAVVQDASGMAEKLGIKVHVIKAGDHKGDGVPGTEVTDAQIAEIQRVVSTMNEDYLGAIAQGLGKNIQEIKTVADGKAIFASDAVKLGLLNGVQTFDETYSQLVAESKRSATQPKGVSMTVETPKPAAATIAELKASFPGSTAEWRESQLMAGATLTEAAMAYGKHMDETLKSEREAHAQALAKAADDAKASGKKGSLGHKPLNSISGEDADQAIDAGDPVQAFNELVQKYMGSSQGYESRQRAIRLAASKAPELYQAYMLETNPGALKNRLLTEKQSVNS